MEDKKIDERIEEEMKRQLKELSEVQVGTNESKAIIDDFVELSKTLVEQKKVAIEAEKVEAEKEMNSRKLDHDELKQCDQVMISNLDRAEMKKQRWSTTILQGIGVGATLAATMMGHIVTSKLLETVLKFESTGEYVTSSAGKSLIGTIFRRK